MREFANVNLQDINFRSLTALREIRTKFLQRINPHLEVAGDLTSDPLLQYLQKYIATRTNLSKDPSERLAKILAYIPEDEQLIGNTNVNIGLLVLKIAFRQHGYPKDSICKLSFEERLAAVIKLQSKRKLCYHDDWAFEVNKICNCLAYKQLFLAAEEMQKIIEITYRESSYTYQQRANLFSLQVINCIDIIEFIYNNQQFAEFNQIYALATKTLIGAINKLKKLPEDLCANHVFFSWNIFKSSQNSRIVPVNEEEYVTSQPRIRQSMNL